MPNKTDRRKFLQQLSVLSITPAFLNVNDTIHRKGIHRIGYFSGANTLLLEKAFTDELANLGFRQGENIHIEMRLARLNSNDTPTMGAELAGMDLSLIVAGALPFALEIRKNNPRMPMVIGTCPGMISNGFARNLQNPGGIYTGMDELPEGVTRKRLELLKAIAPDATRIALLSTTPGTGGHEIQLTEAQQAASALGIEVKSYRATNQHELEKALAAVVADGMSGLLSFQGGLALANRKMIADFARQHRLPAIYQATAFAEAGGLMAWAPDLPKQFQEAAHYVAKILKGDKPGDLPIKQPEKYYLTLNKTAADNLGIKVPEKLMAEAHKVIQ